jgi:hypothetical protein
MDRGLFVWPNHSRETKMSKQEEDDDLKKKDGAGNLPMFLAK